MVRRRVVARRARVPRDTADDQHRRARGRLHRSGREDDSAASRGGESRRAARAKVAGMDGAVRSYVDLFYSIVATGRTMSRSISRQRFSMLAPTHLVSNRHSSFVVRHIDDDVGLRRHAEAIAAAQDDRVRASRTGSAPRRAQPHAEPVIDRHIGIGSGRRLL